MKLLRLKNYLNLEIQPNAIYTKVAQIKFEMVDWFSVKNFNV